MSDSESFESQTDTEQSTDNDDVVEPQSSLVQPYQFEPVATKLPNTRPLVIFHCVAIFSVATARQIRSHALSNYNIKEIRHYINVSFF